MKLTARENDVIAAARMFLQQLGEHPGKNFVVNADMVPEFLGTLLLMKERLENPEEAAKFAGPREFAEDYLRRSKMDESKLHLLIHG